MNNNVFEFKDYKSYLKALIASKPKGGRGIKMALAKEMNSPVSHISQVLNGKSQLSMEQAEAVNKFFGHTQEECNFFFLLLQYKRAGTLALKQRLENQMAQILERRMNLKERLGIQPALSQENQVQFYSSWIYGAIHVMLSIEKFQTKEALSKYLGISLKRVGEILEFLVSTGLAIESNKGRFNIGTSRIHLGNDSPMISKFHTNWRMRAIQSLENEDFKNDLHYSSAITISEADCLKIKSRLIQVIEETKAVIRDSKEEGAHCLSLDFFRI